MENVSWMDFFVYLPLAALGFFLKSFYANTERRVSALEKGHTDQDKDIAVLQANAQTQQSHIDRRFDDLDKKIDSLFKLIEKLNDKAK